MFKIVKKIFKVVIQKLAFDISEASRRLVSLIIIELCLDVGCLSITFSLLGSIRVGVNIILSPGKFFQ